MRSLPCPSRERVREHLVVALDAKGYPFTTTQLDAVLDLYDRYDAVLGAPEPSLRGQQIEASLGDAIRNSYPLLRPNRKLFSVRADIMRRADRCPFCSLLASSELDHHLPKAKYSPLAIYSLNLVPACHLCNNAKSDLDSSQPNQRFVHAYLEPLPNVRFLDAVVDLEDGALVVEFRVNKAAKLPDLLLERLRHQFQRLRLNERYRREANTLLANHATALSTIFDAGGSCAVRTYLERQAAFEFQRFHANHWSAVLLLSLSGHTDFCQGGF